MSIISIVYLPVGIAVAADSRLTGHRTVANPDSTKILEQFPISDNSQKIVLLNKCPVGIASFGTAIINGATIADYIRLFEINDVEIADSPTIVAEKLLQHLEEFEGTCFYICGYESDVPFVYLMDSNGLKRINTTQDGSIDYGLAWGGEPEALNKLINSKPNMNINYKLMPLKDGIDLSKFMVETTINYQRFSDRIKTCGGPIDILVLTKDSAFWYRNKLYS